MEVAEMNSPQTLALGNCAFSTSATRQPARASSRAAAEPAGPAPITAASYMAALGDEEMGERKDAALGDGPARPAGPEAGQFLVLEARAHAAHGIVAGDMIGAQQKHQMRAQQRKGRTSRLAGDKTLGPHADQLQQAAEIGARQVMQKKIGGDDVGGKLRQGLEDVALQDFAAPAQGPEVPLGLAADDGFSIQDHRLDAAP